MISMRNKQRRFVIDFKKVQRNLEKLLAVVGYKDFDIGVLIANNKTMQQYNKEYRKKDKPTDVLSFPYYPDLKPGKRIKASSDDEKNLGDILISPEYVWQQLADYPDWEEKTKAEQKRDLEARINELLVHGLCHLLGYDHLTDSQYRSMRRKEVHLLKVLT